MSAISPSYADSSAILQNINPSINSSSLAWLGTALKVVVYFCFVLFIVIVFCYVIEFLIELFSNNDVPVIEATQVLHPTYPLPPNLRYLSKTLPTSLNNSFGYKNKKTAMKLPSITERSTENVENDSLETETSTIVSSTNFNSRSESNLNSRLNFNSEFLNFNNKKTNFLYQTLDQATLPPPNNPSSILSPRPQNPSERSSLSDYSNQALSGKQDKDIQPQSNLSCTPNLSTTPLKSKKMSQRGSLHNIHVLNNEKKPLILEPTPPKKTTISSKAPPIKDQKIQKLELDFNEKIFSSKSTSLKTILKKNNKVKVLINLSVKNINYSVCLIHNPKKKLIKIGKIITDCKIALFYVDSIAGQKIRSVLMNQGLQRQEINEYQIKDKNLTNYDYIYWRPKPAFVKNIKHFFINLFQSIKKALSF